MIEIQQQDQFHHPHHSPHTAHHSTGNRSRQQEDQQQDKAHEERPQNLTKCAKMTTEELLKNGISMNGGGGGGFSERPPKPLGRNSTSSSSSSTSPTTSGRNSPPFRPQYDIAQLMDSSSSSSSSPKRLPFSSISAATGGCTDLTKWSSSAKTTSSPRESHSNKSSNDSPPGGNGQGVGTRVNGGRLQFFKDGKFILELASSREAENGRTGWVMVPRKIFWPPTQQGFNSFNNSSIIKNESSASLSFSDDNSSIQSSPWQRDHCWKQATPRRNISREMCLHYFRPRQMVKITTTGHRISQRKRRKPYDTACKSVLGGSFRVLDRRAAANNQRTVKVEKTELNSNLLCTTSTAEKEEGGGSASSTTEEGKEDDSRKVDEKVTEEEKMVEEEDASEIKIKQENDDGSDIPLKEDGAQQTGDQKNASARTDADEVDAPVPRDDCKTEDNSKRINKKTAKKKGLESIVNTLLTSRKSLLAKLKASSSSPKLDNILQLHQHVSPRKRILREFERVSLDDSQNSVMKRHRTKISSSNGIPSPLSATNNGGHPPRSSNNNNNNNSNNLSGPIHSNTFFVPSTITSNNSVNSSSNNNNPSSGINKLANGGNAKELLVPPSSLSTATTVPISRQHQSMSIKANSSAAPTTPTTTTVSKPISSYSIISLLGHNSSARESNEPPPQQPPLSSHHHHSQPQQQQHAFQKEMPLSSMGFASKSPMDIQVYNKSLPPKKKLSSPPHGSWSPKITSPSSIRNVASSSSPSNDSPMSLINYNLMRSPELSPSPEHLSSGGPASRYKSPYGLQQHGPSSSGPYHPYLNVSMRSPSETMSSASSSTTDVSNRYRSSPQYIRENRATNSGSPNSRYSPIASNYDRKTSGGGNNHQRNQIESPNRSNSSPINHHLDPKKSLRSPSPLHHNYRGHPREMLDANRLAMEEELKSKEEHAKQLELERYAKSLYGHSSAGGAMQHAHLMPPGFDLAEHHHHANMIRPLMSSLQNAYFLYPPPPPPNGNSSGGVPNGSQGSSQPQPPSSPYLPSVPYYSPSMSSYMAAAAAASYRNPALWYSSPLPHHSPHSNRLAAAHSAALLSSYNASTMAAAAAAHAAATAAEMERSSPLSPPKLYHTPMAREIMEQQKDEDVPLNLSKH